MISTPPNLQDINLQAYTYELPEDRIAKHPLPQRDLAKLQVYRQGKIEHSQFSQLSNYIPKGTLLVFNNTRVIPARLLFQKPSTNGMPGAQIEIFLLEPEQPSRILSEAMQAQGTTTWHCLIGNQKRWRPGTVLEHIVSIESVSVTLSARLIDPQASLVELSWQPAAYSFAQIVRYSGEMPLPPYLKRKAAQADEEQYQTVYSRKEGAVAAPTAGLHFTPEVLASLEKKGIATQFLTLHVGAGTFQPIKVNNVWQHPMHAEQLIFTQENVQRILENLPIVFAVGTTSLRALESLYWYGVKLRHKVGNAHFHIEKLLPYQFAGEALPTATESIETVLECMRQKELKELVGETEILIAPGYQFRIVKGLITNYHLPGTTLMLLIAAFIGDDWQRVYQEALQHNYRFLSYGDSSLLIP